MSPTIVFIRHAQALHNVANNSPQDYELHDPPLSELGVKQCAELRKSLLSRFGHVKRVAIVASPMRRTLETAMLSVDWLLERGVTVEADAEWQENSHKPCDTGSPIPFLTADFPPPAIDFSHVDALWPDKTSHTARQLYGYSRNAIVKRGTRCLEQLYQRTDVDVVLVFSHSGFLRVGVTGWFFHNADYRVFEFGDGFSDEDANGGERRRVLSQDETTLEGGLGWSWAKTEPLGTDLPDDE